MAVNMTIDTVTWQDVVRVAKENGYRLKDIAEALSCHQERISDWKKYDRTPSRFYRQQFPALIERMKAEPRPARSVNT